MAAVTGQNLALLLRFLEERKNQCAEIKATSPEGTIFGFGVDEHEIRPGRKYDKLVEISRGNEFVLAYVDKDLNVYKPDGRRPTKTVRAIINEDNVSQQARASLNGGWLYR